MPVVLVLVLVHGVGATTALRRAARAGGASAAPGPSDVLA